MAQRNQGREHRVADLIQRELATALRTELSDPRVELVTITEVDVTRDLSLARVYVSSLTHGSAAKDDVLAALNGAGSFLRGLIAKRAKLRMTPRLQFHYDDSAERGAQMDGLIRTVRSRDDALAKAAADITPRRAGEQS